MKGFRAPYLHTNATQLPVQGKALEKVNLIIHICIKCYIGPSVVTAY